MNFLRESTVSNTLIRIFPEKKNKREVCLLGSLDQLSVATEEMCVKLGHYEKATKLENISYLF